MTEQTHARQLVIFTLGAEQYALPIEQVQEIIRYSPPRSVASAERWIQGVLNLRGRIVPIYDLAARLGVASELGDETKIVVVEAASQTVGVVVDAVNEVLTVEEAQLEAVPIADRTLTESLAKLGERLVVLLSPSTIFTGLGAA